MVIIDCTIYEKVKIFRIILNYHLLVDGNLVRFQMLGLRVNIGHLLRFHPMVMTHITCDWYLQM